MFKDKEFNASLFKIAIPIIIQQSFMCSLNYVDLIMIGQLSETSVVAVGAANQLFFIFSCLVSGLTDGVAIFSAQYWGKRDVKNIKKVLGYSLPLSIFIGFLFFVLSIFFPGVIVKQYSHDAKVIGQGIDYLRVAGLSYVFTAITFCFVSVLRSIQDIKIPVTASVIALLLNSSLNYILIFGHLGFPSLGVKGAALATLISRGVEMSIVIFHIYHKNSPASISICHILSLDYNFFKLFMKISIPHVLSLMTWSLGLAAYQIIFSKMGTNAYAAVNIAQTVEALTFVLFTGLSGAASVMIGNQIGANNMHRILTYSKKFFIFGISMALFLGCLMAIGGNILLSFYEISAATHNFAAMLIKVYAALLWIKVLNMLLYSILCAGGDTKYSFLISTTALWFFGIPTVFIGAIIFEFPVYIVMILVFSEELVKLIGGLHRFFSRKWIRRIIS
ncbi:MAG: hypothetical protein QG657_3723 [Acidobacteriota bacterium]|nr:hypothetical protein [Acidobacteriota bacterium]